MSNTTSKSGNTTNLWYIKLFRRYLFDDYAAKTDAENKRNELAKTYGIENVKVIQSVRQEG